MPAERICRGCEKVRTPGRTGRIEGPCPSCGGYYRTVLKRGRGAEDEADLLDGPESADALFARHDDDPSLALRPTGLRGVDHVFGGGLPQSGTILISAQEGSGKSTLLLELLLTLAVARIRGLYFGLEQGKKEIVRQFGRLGLDRIARAGTYLKIDACKDLLDILHTIGRCRPHVVAIDSVHWVEGVLDDHDQPMKSGSAGAVERVAKDLHDLAEERGLLIFLVGHMNNDGTMAGGHGLRHAVDATLGLRRVTENKRDPRRILCFESKTRFGEMGREALFRMTEAGLQDCGPILDEAEGEDDKPAPRARAPRRPREDGQVIRFPGRKRPPAGDDEEPPEPPAAA